MYIIYEYNGDQFRKDIVEYAFLSEANLYMMVIDGETIICTPEMTKARRLKDKKIEKIKVLEYSI